MIADSIRNKDWYTCLAPRIARALDYVEQLTVEDFAEQTINIEGTQIYAMYQTYVTESGKDRQYEAHRRYIDVQYILEGEEVILAADLAEMTSRSDYDEGKDIQWFLPKAGSEDGTVNSIHLKAGQFAVFFPQDAHMPKLASGSPEPVKKVVVKIAV